MTKRKFLSTEEGGNGGERGSGESIYGRASCGYSQGNKGRIRLREYEIELKETRKEVVEGTGKKYEAKQMVVVMSLVWLDGVTRRFARIGRGSWGMGLGE